MAEIKPTVTLVTGANRGLGRGLLSALLLRPHNTIIATYRNRYLPEMPEYQALRSLPKAPNTVPHLLEYDAAHPEGAKTLLSNIQKAEITHIDHILANAAFGDTATTVLNTTQWDLERHFDTNLYGPLNLFQVMHRLLRTSQNPKIIAMGSGLGSIGLMEYAPGPWFAYGVTKVAVEYMIRKMHFENEWLTAVVFNPGWIKTEMGRFAAEALGLGMEAVPVEVGDAVEGCLRVVDEASREKFSGQFVDWEGKVVPW